jgi:ceramide glucosyltransferase
MLTAEFLRVIGAVALTGAVAGCAYLTLIVVFIASNRQRRKADVLLPPVSVLVPLSGAEPELAARLQALRLQDYPAPAQIVCGVLDATDAAIAEVRAASLGRSGFDIDLAIDPRISGTNLKVSNLINMMARARHDTIVLIDSDIEVGPEHLKAVVSELQQGDVGGVTCLYGGVTKGGIWARLAAMQVNLHFLPNVVFALTVKAARPCFGSTIALSRNTLRRIGGFHAFSDHLWDDYAIGEAIRGLGLKVAIPGFAVGHVCSEQSGRELLGRQLRFARTIKNIDPLGYVGGIVTNPVALALVAVLARGGSLAVAVMLAALVCRVSVAWAVERRFGVERAPLLLIPVLDCLSFAIYAVSLLGASVEWRGQRYRVQSDGTMTQRSD